MQQLDQAGQRIGPFVFNRIDLFDVTVIANNADAPAFQSRRQAAFLQIDRPAWSQQQRWREELQDHFITIVRSEAKDGFKFLSEVGIRDIAVKPDR